MGAIGLLDCLRGAARGCEAVPVVVHLRRSCLKLTDCSLASSDRGRRWSRAAKHARGSLHGM